MFSLRIIAWTRYYEGLLWLSLMIHRQVRATSRLPQGGRKVEDAARFGGFLVADLCEFADSVMVEEETLKQRGGKIGP